MTQRFCPRQLANDRRTSLEGPARLGQRTPLVAATRSVLFAVAAFIGLAVGTDFAGLIGGTSLSANEPLPPPADGQVDFVRDVQPIFQARCVSCHGAKQQKGGYRLDVKAVALRGGENFLPAIVPGKSADSPLVRMVAGLEEGFTMPAEGERLSPAQIGILRAWIDQGARWPDSAAGAAVDKSADHWAWKPIRRPAVPDFRDSPAAPGTPSIPTDGASAPRNSRASRIHNPLDAFIEQRLAEQQLTPVAAADRATLLRRVYFDLLGLPPTPEETEAFLADRDPLAYERLIDQLLASPRLGERWTRHWLDVVRFAESDGFETNQPRPNAWPYRDYVIRAFNADKPYDQFVFEQLAGDTVGEDAATGFVVGGPWDRVKSPDIVLTLTQRADELHDMVSTTGSTLLGVTVGCARCHNHKFDPVTQFDYYGLRAVFAGVQHGERQIRPADYDARLARGDQMRAEIARIDAQLRSFEPPAFVGATLLLDDDTPGVSNPDAPSVTQVVPRKGLEPHQPGAARGQAGDPGDVDRLPNLGRNYSYWNKVAGQDVFTWNPRIEGRRRVWLSWGCGWNTHAVDARYLLDRDGQLDTRDDQTEIARIDQRQFADGTGGVPGQPLWSGFRDAGVHEFTKTSRIVLRGGDSDAYVTADLLCLQTEPQSPSPAASPPVASPPVASPPADAQSRPVAPHQPHLRSAVSRRANIERFAPIEARFVRMTIMATTGAEPCLDELEAFAAGPGEPRNVALASAGGKASASSSLPGYEIHQLAHVNDGRYGNDWSWISNERNKGWVQIEWPTPVLIDRVVWSRDRAEPGRFSDRTATQYVIEVALEPGQWRVVADSNDRLPASLREGPLATLAPPPAAPSLAAGSAAGGAAAANSATAGGAATSAGAANVDAQVYRKLVERRQSLADELQGLTQTSMVYAGRFTAPEPTFRLHRGDPMQKREPVGPSGIAALGAKWQLPDGAPDAERRQALARWIIDPSHPLTARVIVNRLWHYHFGQGIVATPSDFGVNGARPTHPELLDWLAAELIESGWQLKHVHRLILLSAAYRRSAAPSDAGLRADASSRLLWRFPPRRLEAEVLRDAILSVSGSIELRMGGPGFDLFEPNTNYVKVYNSKHEFAANDFRRMVYQNKPRMQLDDVFGAFDCPDAGQVAPKRNSSNTPLQALNLLNSPFLLDQAQRMAERLTRDAGPAVDSQIDRAFQLAFSRRPTDDERAASRQLIEQHGLPVFCRAMLNANEFLYVY